MVRAEISLLVQGIEKVRDANGLIFIFYRSDFLQSGDLGGKVRTSLPNRMYTCHDLSGLYFLYVTVGGANLFPLSHCARFLTRFTSRNTFSSLSISKRHY